MQRWWDVHICIYFVSNVVFVYFLIKSSFQKNKKTITLTGKSLDESSSDYLCYDIMLSVIEGDRSFKK